MQSWKWRRGLCCVLLAGGVFQVSLVGTGDLQAVEPRATAAAAQAKSVEMLQQQAREKISQRKFKEAAELLTQVLAKDKEQVSAYYVRGRANFQLGEIKQSVKDFDAYVKRRPQVESRQWERGIALYYAAEFKRGAQQFELYQTFHDNDVENSVWRFLCMARSEGVEKARRVILPIKNDPRVPMMQVFEMYRGTVKPAEVLKAVHADKPTGDVLKGRLFYAHLYLGLYHEAIGNKEEAEKYIRLAAQESLKTNPRINTYMWDVARIHLEQFEKIKKLPK
jgi:lipoprotein NlpI